MAFSGPARDTVLTNQQTEKLNFDTKYITKPFTCWENGGRDEPGDMCGFQIKTKKNQY
jgi:hypothetical protein